jgi:hypothetical protein
MNLHSEPRHASSAKHMPLHLKESSPFSETECRLLLINPVAVEKLASEKSAKIKTRQEALQTIFFDD